MSWRRGAATAARGLWPSREAGVSTPRPLERISTLAGARGRDHLGEVPRICLSAPLSWARIAACLAAAMVVAQLQHVAPPSFLGGRAFCDAPASEKLNTGDVGCGAPPRRRESWRVASPDGAAAALADGLFAHDGAAGDAWLVGLNFHVTETSSRELVRRGASVRVRARGAAVLRRAAAAVARARALRGPRCAPRNRIDATAHRDPPASAALRATTARGRRAQATRCARGCRCLLHFLEIERD